MNSVNPLQHINWVDVLAFVTLFRAAVIGFKRGVSGELFDFMAAVSAMFVGLYGYERLGVWLRWRVAVPHAVSEFIALLALVVTVLLVWKLVEFAAGSVARLEVVPHLNAFGGMALGVLRGTMLLSLLLLGLELTSLEYMRASIEQRSLFGAGMRNVAPSVCQAVWRTLPSRPSGTS